MGGATVASTCFRRSRWVGAGWFGDRSEAPPLAMSSLPAEPSEAEPSLGGTESRGPKVTSGHSAVARVPGRTREQRLRALRLANEIRSARAKLKKELASGKIEPAQILARPPECVRTARVRDVLLALPKIGPVKAGRILADCGIAHSKTLGGLTERQRAELLNRFRRGGHDK
jgi:hypothetical protein